MKPKVHNRRRNEQIDIGGMGDPQNHRWVIDFFELTPLQGYIHFPSSDRRHHRWLAEKSNIFPLPGHILRLREEEKRNPLFSCVWYTQTDEFLLNHSIFYRQNFLFTRDFYFMFQVRMELSLCSVAVEWVKNFFRLTLGGKHQIYNEILNVIFEKLKIFLERLYRVIRRRVAGCYYFSPSRSLS